ncbi:glycosyltransferase [Bowmanella denitrificans]|uniref:glycosyltransferase n=1 Tax=Bowmanella denitrificans TaxID=366582 RepID=UPI000C9CB967|nr:glycosyltransferase [Bowmanella denitrificans]
MSKRIAIVIDSLAGGGAERSMLTLAVAMQNLGHQPYLLVLQEFGLYHVPASLPVYYWQKGKHRSCDPILGMEKLAQDFRNWIERIQTEVGQFDAYYSNLDKSNLLMSRAQVTPSFYVVHNAIQEELNKQKRMGPIKYYKMYRAKRALDKKDLITVSAGIAKELESCKLASPNSVKTIYNPFDIADIKLQSEQQVAGLPQTDYIIHVGRFAKQKRHDVLFRALRHCQTSLPVVLLCNNIKKARKMAKVYGVEDKVILPGFQSNPYPWIKQAKLMVLSSDHEGLGNVLIESLICGTPVVSTDCPHGPREIMTGFLSEFLVPCRDHKSLAKAIDKALCSYPDLQSVEILKQVDASTVAKSYLKLIEL